VDPTARGNVLIDDQLIQDEDKRVIVARSYAEQKIVVTMVDN
jgi:hypothetical protein